MDREKGQERISFWQTLPGAPGEKNQNFHLPCRENPYNRGTSASKTTDCNSKLSKLPPGTGSNPSKKSTPALFTSNTLPGFNSSPGNRTPYLILPYSKRSGEFPPEKGRRKIHVPSFRRKSKSWGNLCPGNWHRKRFMWALQRTFSKDSTGRAWMKRSMGSWGMAVLPSPAEKWNGCIVQQAFRSSAILRR